MIVGVLLYFILSCFLIPLAYVLVIKFKLMKLFSKESNKLTKFACVGVFYLFALCIYDTVIFCISLFDRKLKLRSPKNDNDNIISSIDPQILEYFIQLCEKKKESANILESLELIKEIREDFNISNIIIEFIYKGNEDKAAQFTTIEETKGKVFDSNNEEEKYIDKNEDINHQDMLNEILFDKTPKFILLQYNMIKRLILTNSINLEDEEFQNIKTVKIELSRSSFVIDSFKLRNGILGKAGTKAAQK